MRITWSWNQPLTNVPAGCRVQILHISGDFISWAMGAVPAGTHAGVGNGNVARIPFNQDVVEGYLASDNVLSWKVAEFLNTTGLTIHLEITFSQVVFRFVQ